MSRKKKTTITNYSVQPDWSKNAHITAERYQRMYQESITNPHQFWADEALRHINWFQPWKTVCTGDFNAPPIRWFTEGKLNACYNCLDRHLPKYAEKTALIWQGNQPEEQKHLSYHALHTKVLRAASALKTLGVSKGQRVCIYLPMIPELIISMLACARIGAIHTVVFAGYSSDALKTRIIDANCSLLITADESVRGERRIPLKQQADNALVDCSFVSQVLVVKRTGNPVPWNPSRDSWYDDCIRNAPADCPIEWMDANDPLFILYTSGSTGKPKGILHTTGGYLVYVASTFYNVFDYRETDIHWCTADIGWITGHSYVVYGPLLNAATTLLFEGVPHYPNRARFWDIIDQHSVSIFYTAPTAIRMLRGDNSIMQSERKHLRILGSVGEPLNPDVWTWFYTVVGKSQCSIVNTWWQTETGGMILSAFPGATPLIPGAAGWPFFGIQVHLVDDLGARITAPHVSGHLVISTPWPGLMHSIYRDQQRFIDTYLTPLPGYYFTGDGGYWDNNQQLYITGRDDDVLKISGHRFGSEELESALISNYYVREAAVVGIEDAITGQSIYAFVILNTGIKPTEAIKQALIQHVRSRIGAIATLAHIQWARTLPKTRSGKIVRRILRHIARNECDQLGDTSTLESTQMIQELIDNRRLIQ